MVIPLSECILSVFQSTYYFCTWRLNLQSFSSFHTLSTLSDSQIPSYYKSHNFHRNTISTDTHIHNESFARHCLKELDIIILLLNAQHLSNSKFLLVLFFTASLMNIHLLGLSKTSSFEIKLSELVKWLELFIVSSLCNILFYLHISLDVCRCIFLYSGEKRTFPGCKSSNLYQIFLLGKGTLNAPFSVLSQ